MNKKQGENWVKSFFLPKGYHKEESVEAIPKRNIRFMQLKNPDGIWCEATIVVVLAPPLLLSNVEPMTAETFDWDTKPANLFVAAVQVPTTTTIATSCFLHEPDHLDVCACTT